MTNQRHCQALNIMSKANLLAYLTDNSRIKAKLENLDDDAWSILSFNPYKREVCIRIISSGVTFVIILPEIQTPPSSLF